MVKGSEYVELKGAGHLTMWDAWGAYSKAVRSFLGKSERRGI